MNCQFVVVGGGIAGVSCAEEVCVGISYFLSSCRVVVVVFLAVKAVS